MLRGVAEHRDPEKLELYLAETSPANRFGVGLVAEVDGKAVGFVAGAGIAVALSGLDVSEEDITRRIGLLDILAVHPDYQRRGIGALLCTTLLDRFRDTGQRLVVAKLANGRRDLIPIYAGWGWSVGGNGSGLAVELGSHPIVIAEHPAERIAWKALSSRVRPGSSGVQGEVAVSGMFD